MLKGYRVIKTLTDHGTHLVHRAEELSSGKKVILKSIAPDEVNACSLVALTNEFKFLQSISSEYVIKSFDLRKNEEGHTFLILEDIDGTSLSTFLHHNEPLPLDQFFTIAIAITRGLNQIHAASIIHKDISPKNIVINLEAKHIKIIDFSIATKLTRESQEINVKDVLEGSLPYISPEQTGRINRYLDYRSDFYSLGATFYKMLVGQPPFVATDGLGYIAAHIAKSPQRVDEQRTDVPPNVATMIDTLLAKSADDRYQSSAGLIYDLEQLQEIYLRKQKDPTFSLRSRDQSERFDLPQKLYGREKDIAKLFAKFDKAAEGGATVLLVRGPSGIGKSSLIQEVNRKFSGNQVFFLKGKFDLFNKDIPYSALTHAFIDAAEQIVRMEKNAYNAFTDEIRHLLGPNGEVITGLIPEFLAILGTPPPLPILNPQESHVRVSNTLLDFFSAFARPHAPLVLFLDDMQWADLATLDLLESFFTKAEFKNIFIILSYRTNEVPDHHPLALTLLNLAKKTALDTIDLEPLTLSDINQMVADTLKIGSHRVAELADILSQKTQGNPFFIEEFLKDLWRKKLIYFDHKHGLWQCNINDIRELDVSGSIMEFLLHKIAVLDNTSLEVLKLAAVLGNKFQLSTLSLVLERSMLETLQSLDEPIKEGLIIPLDNGYRILQSSDLWTKGTAPVFDTALKFQHDRIQQVCCNLIAAKDKKTVHLAIARILENRKDKLQVPVTDIVHHYNEALNLITDDSERIKLIELNRSAIKKALGSNAYSTASEYIKVAMYLHYEQDWLDHYALMFDIYKYAAEISYYLNDVNEGNDFVDKLLANTKDTLIKAEILTMQSAHLTSIGYLREAIDVAISSLRLCGYSFSRETNLFYIGIIVIKIVAIIMFKSSKNLLKMPTITDARRNLALRNFTSIGNAEFNLGNPFGYAVAFFNATLITLKYGFSDLAGHSFAATSAVLMGVFKMGKMSRKLGMLAVEYQKRTDDLYSRSNTATILACFTYYWHYDHKDLSQHFTQALQLAYQSGDDFHRASAAACHVRYLSDVTVEQAFSLNSKMRTIAQESNSQQNKECLEIIQGHYANLLGITDYGHSSTYRGYNEIASRRHVQKTGNLTGMGGYIAMKLEALTLRERFKEAVWYSHKWRSALFGVIATKYEADYRFYTFLARVKYTGRGLFFAPLWNLMQIFFQRGCLWVYWRNNPANFDDMETIARAEMDVFFNRPVAQTLAKFEEAIKVCKNKSNSMAAIACHRAFLFASSRNLQRLAESYYSEAFKYYESWGALGICAFLSGKYGTKYNVGQMYALSATKQSSPMMSYQSHTTHHNIAAHSRDENSITAANFDVDSVGRELDMDSITKSVQAIFAENKLGNLTNSILAAMMENAGASSGALILKDDNDNLIIHGLIDNDLSLKTFEPHAMTVNEVPKTFVISALRTGKVGIIFDVSHKNPFASDPYFEATWAKSALVIPISFKRAVVGGVYLQNSHIVNAFTAEHRHVLDIMAVSAAASIVNTRLQLSLEEKVRAKAKAVKAMLENVEQGILMIYDDELRIHPEYSSYLEEIIERKDLGNQRISDILFAAAYLTTDQRNTLLSSLSSMINTPVITFRMNEHHLPHNIKYEICGKIKILELDWSPILSEDEKVEKILLTIRDVTKVENLQLEINQRRGDLQIFREITKISYDLFQEFVDQSQTTLTQLVAFKQHDSAVLQNMFIEIHTLKGLARTYGFITLVDCYHQVEQELAHSLKSECQFFEHLTTALQNLDTALQQYVRVAAIQFDRNSIMAIQSLKHIEQILTHEIRGQRSDREAFFDSLCNAIYPTLRDILQGEIASINDTAQSLNKEPPVLHFIGDACRYPQETQKMLRQLFVHLFNNSIDHGLEPASERLARGKSAAGNITIEFIADDDHPMLIFSDDGRGLDLKVVRAVAERKGLIEAQSVLTPEATAELIFTPEFSTKSDITAISGRGIGMSAVKALLKTYNCELQFRLGAEDPQGYRGLKLLLILSKQMVVSKPEKRLRLVS